MFDYLWVGSPEKYKTMNYSILGKLSDRGIFYFGNIIFHIIHNLVHIYIREKSTLCDFM